MRDDVEQIAGANRQQKALPQAQLRVMPLQHLKKDYYGYIH